MVTVDHALREWPCSKVLEAYLQTVAKSSGNSPCSVRIRVSNCHAAGRHILAACVDVLEPGTVKPPHAPAPALASATSAATTAPDTAR